MVEYRTKKGMIVISKVKELSIKEIKLSEELFSWCKLHPESYYIEIIPKKPTIKKIGLNLPILSLTKRYFFLDYGAIDEYNVLLEVRHSIEIAVKNEIYPRVLLEIMDEAINLHYKNKSIL